jgi:hypothetical protein
MDEGVGGRPAKGLDLGSSVADRFHHQGHVYYGSNSVIRASCARRLKDRAIGYSASSLCMNVRALSVAEFYRRIRQGLGDT